jgi:hypothetical protein
LDELGDDRTNGLSISLEAGNPVTTLSESRMDLDSLMELGEGSDDVADVVAEVTVGVGGREIV